MTARRLLPPLTLYLLAAILLGLFAVGSLADLTISESLYDPTNPLGTALAAYGEAPTFMAWTSAGTLLLVARSRSSQNAALLQSSAGGLLISAALVSFAVIPGGYWAGPLLVRIAIGLVVVGGTVYVTARLAVSANRQTCLKVATALIVVVFAQLIVVTVVKILWERPRMRMLEATPGAHFQPWWSPGYAGRIELLLAGVSGEEFKSFPSGHTANAATALLATTFVALRPRLEAKVNIIFWVGASWGFLVALSRIIVGAHFLTDTVAGYAITLVVLVVTYRFVFSERIHKNRMENLL